MKLFLITFQVIDSEGKTFADDIMIASETEASARDFFFTITKGFGVRGATGIFYDLHAAGTRVQIIEASKVKDGKRERSAPDGAKRHAEQPEPARRGTAKPKRRK